VKTYIGGTANHRKLKLNIIRVKASPKIFIVYIDGHLINILQNGAGLKRSVR
jgi:hypothetical protein